MGGDEHAHGGGHGHGGGGHSEEERSYVGPKEEKNLFALVLSSLHGVTCGTLGVENKVEAHGHGHGHGHGSEHSHDQQLAEEAHQDATQVWFGLFTDLIFVAVIVQFANQFKLWFKGFYATNKGDPNADIEFYSAAFVNECKALYKMGAKSTGPYFSSKGYECFKQGGQKYFSTLLGQAFLYFYAFWICWLELTCTLARFINIEGLVDDFLYMAYLLGIVVMSVQMSQTEKLFTNIGPFACGLAVSMMAMCFLHIFFVIKAPESRDYSYRRIFSYLVASILFIVSAVLPGVDLSNDDPDPTTSAILIAIGLTIILWVSLTSFMVQADCMNTMEYFTERFGILVMIVTGESILALMLGDKSDPNDTFKNSSKDYQTVYISFAIMYIVKNIYFQSHAEEEYHALNEPGFPGSCLWVFLHLPLTFFLLGCGVGFKLMFTQIYSSGLDTNFALVMGMSLTGVVVTMLLIRTAHRKYILQHWVTYATRVPTLVLIPMGVWICDDVIAYLTWCLALVFVSYCWDLTILEKWEIEKEVKDLKTKKELQLAKERGEKVAKMQQMKESDDKTNKGICRKSIGNCLRSIPTCDSDEYANWEQGGFNGPPDEIPPYYLPYDVVCCITDMGYMRVTEEVAPGKTGMLHELHDLHDQDEEAAHHEESNKDWLGEFTDLIFVAIIIKFADQIKFVTKYGGDKTKMPYAPKMRQIVGESFLYYIGFFAVWLEMTCEFIRFKNMPGVFDDMLRFFYLLGIVTMALQIEEAKYMTENAMGYMVGYLMCMVTQLIVHTIYYARLDRAERYARWRIMTYSVSCIALVVGVLVTSGIDTKDHPNGPADHPAYAEVVAIILCVSCFIIFVSINSFRVAFLPELDENEAIVWQDDPHHGKVMKKPKAGRAPEDDEEFIERFGLLIMITTGESVLALIVGASSVFQQNAQNYIVVLMSYIVMFYLKNLYFTSSQLKLHEGHALLEKDIPGGVCWVVCHGILAYLLLMCGVGFKLIFATMVDDLTAYDQKYKDNFTSYTNILCLSVALAVVMILIIRLAHDYFIWSMWTGPFRVIPVVLIGCSGFIFKPNDNWAQAYICIWLFIWIILLDVYDNFILLSYDGRFRDFEVAVKKYETKKGSEAKAHAPSGTTEMAAHHGNASKGGIQHQG